MKRIFIVDDHPMLRDGLKINIAREPELEVCGYAENGADAARSIPGAAADLVIMDLSLPDKNGLELAKELLEACPSLSILVFSMHDEMVYAERVIRAGCRGYLMKGSSADTLSHAMQRVLSGELFTSAAVSNHMIRGLSKRGRPGGFGVGRLTDQELEVFEQIGAGKSNSEIATIFGVSASTVAAHRTSIKGKLDAPDGPAMVRLAALWTDKGATMAGN